MGGAEGSSEGCSGLQGSKSRIHYHPRNQGQGEEIVFHSQRGPEPGREFFQEGPPCKSRVGERTQPLPGCHLVGENSSRRGWGGCVCADALTSPSSQLWSPVAQPNWQLEDQSTYMMQTL